MSDLSAAIEAAWEKRDSLGVTSKGAERDAVEAALDGLDNGSLRVAEKIDGAWKVHEWLKKAVLLSFRLNDMKLISGAPGEAVWWDKVDSKFLGWDEAKFRAHGIELRYHEYHNQTYPQCHPDVEFVSDLSAVDMIWL